MLPIRHKVLMIVLMEALLCLFDVWCIADSFLTLTHNHWLIFDNITTQLDKKNNVPQIKHQLNYKTKKYSLFRFF